MSLGPVGNQPVFHCALCEQPRYQLTDGLCNTCEGRAVLYAQDGLAAIDRYLARWARFTEWLIDREVVGLA